MKKKQMPFLLLKKKKSHAGPFSILSEVLLATIHFDNTVTGRWYLADQLPSERGKPTIRRVPSASPRSRLASVNAGEPPPAADSDESSIPLGTIQARVRNAHSGSQR